MEGRQEQIDDLGGEQSLNTPDELPLTQRAIVQSKVETVINAFSESDDGSSSLEKTGLFVERLIVEGLAERSDDTRNGVGKFRIKNQVLLERINSAYDECREALGDLNLEAMFKLLATGFPEVITYSSYVSWRSRLKGVAWLTVAEFDLVFTIFRFVDSGNLFTDVPGQEAIAKGLVRFDPRFAACFTADNMPVISLAKTRKGKLALRPDGADVIDGKKIPGLTTQGTHSGRVKIDKDTKEGRLLSSKLIKSFSELKSMLGLDTVRLPEFFDAFLKPVLAPLSYGYQSFENRINGTNGMTRRELAYFLNIHEAVEWYWRLSGRANMLEPKDAIRDALCRLNPDFKSGFGVLGMLKDAQGQTSKGEQLEFAQLQRKLLSEVLDQDEFDERGPGELESRAPVELKYLMPGVRKIDGDHVMLATDLDAQWLAKRIKFGLTTLVKALGFGGSDRRVSMRLVYDFLYRLGTSSSFTGFTLGYVSIMQNFSATNPRKMRLAEFELVMELVGLGELAAQGVLRLADLQTRLLELDQGFAACFVDQKRQGEVVKLDELSLLREYFGEAALSQLPTTSSLPQELGQCFDFGSERADGVTLSLVARDGVVAGVWLEDGNSGHKFWLRRDPKQTPDVEQLRQQLQELLAWTLRIDSGFLQFATEQTGETWQRIFALGSLARPESPAMATYDLGYLNGKPSRAADSALSMNMAGRYESAERLQYEQALHQLTFGGIPELGAGGLYPDLRLPDGGAIWCLPYITELAKWAPLVPDPSRFYCLEGGRETVATYLRAKYPSAHVFYGWSFGREVDETRREIIHPLVRELVRNDDSLCVVNYDPDSNFTMRQATCLADLLVQLHLADRLEPKVTLACNFGASRENDGAEVESYRQVLRSCYPPETLRTIKGIEQMRERVYQVLLPFILQLANQQLADRPLPHQLRTAIYGSYIKGRYWTIGQLVVPETAE